MPRRALSVVALLIAACGSGNDDWLPITETDSLSVYAASSSFEVIGPSLYAVDVRMEPRGDTAWTAEWALDCAIGRTAPRQIRDSTSFSDTTQFWFEPPARTPLALSLERLCPLADSRGVAGEDVRWLHMTTDQDSTEHWLDLQSLSRNHDTTNVWIRLTGPSIQSEYGEGSRILMRASFACNDRQFRELKYVVYDSAGDVAEEEEMGGFPGWQAVVPETNGEFWTETACER